MPTPPVPDYPSTHTVLGAAAAEVLIHFFGDKVAYSATSLTLPGVTRQDQGILAGRARQRPFTHLRGHPFPPRGRRRLHAGEGIGRAVAALLPPVD